MNWVKRGRIFTVGEGEGWMRSHAQCPVVDLIDGDVIRIYFGTRDNDNRTRTTFLDVAAVDPSQVLRIHDRPVMDLGKPGTFDESGVMPSWLVTRRGVKYLYYVGWSPRATVPYHVANGLALSRDGGVTFQRVSPGPIMDRDLSDPIAVSSQCVLVEDGIWKTWYMSFTKWELLGGKWEPFYDIRYAESDDGVLWRRSGRVCLELQPGEGGLARPSVIRDGNLYRMWFSRRGSSGYRERGPAAYRIGYAESEDGLAWRRLDEKGGVEPSTDGWDDEMVAYPCVLKAGGRWLMFYNGNGFGRAGLGWAECEELD